MSNLTELQSTLPVKLAGASSSGGETNFVNATANGEIKSADFLNAAVVQAVLSVGTAASVEVRAGASRLVNRKSVQIQAQGSNLTYGYTSGSQIFTIANGETLVLSIGDGVGIWLRRASGIGNVNVAIAEFA